MKKLLLVISVIFLFYLLFFSCRANNKSRNNADVPAIEITDYVPDTIVPQPIDKTAVDTNKRVKPDKTKSKK